MLNAITAWIAARWQHDLAMRKLNALDDRLLADMGTSRTDLARFVLAREDAIRSGKSRPARTEDRVRFNLDRVDA